jgi:hypothetical protein
LGYIPNPSKTWLKVKEDINDEAKVAFASSKINISSSGCKHLSSALGKSPFIQDFLKAKVDKWSKELELLTSIAGTECHATYSWAYEQVDILNENHPEYQVFLPLLEDILRRKFIQQSKEGDP